GVLVRGDVDAKPGANIGEGDIRLRSMLDTLRFGRERGWKQVIFGHIGRDPAGSLSKVRDRLEQLLECPVHFVPDWLDPNSLDILPAVTETLNKANPGDVILL